MTQRGLVRSTENRAVEIAQKASHYASRARSANTEKAYGAAWTDFETFCEMHHEMALPATPASVAAYITHLADGQKTSTIEVKLAAIAYYHRHDRLTDPTDDEMVKTVMAGIRRELGTAPDKKSPVTRTQLKTMVQGLPDGLSGDRDKALILVGWAGAFRRSELVNLDVDDLTFMDDRIAVRVRRSKTDQEAQGKMKVLPVLGEANVEICPARALRAWLEHAGIRKGPVFRAVDRWGCIRKSRLSDKTVALVVKAAAERAGLDPDRFAGHSLRRGFITEASNADEEGRNIMAQTGHASERIMRGYIEDAGRGALSAARAAFGEED